MPAGGGAVGGARGGGGSQRSLAGRYGGAPIWWWPPQSPPPPHTHTHHHHHTHTLRAGLSQVPGAGSTTFATSLPVAVPGSRAFATIAAGEYHYCALDPGGSAWCWGGWMGGSPSACQWVAVWGGGGTHSLSNSGACCGLDPGRAAYCRPRLVVLLRQRWRRQVVVVAVVVVLLLLLPHAAAAAGAGQALCFADIGLWQALLRPPPTPTCAPLPPCRPPVCCCRLQHPRPAGRRHHPPSLLLPPPGCRGGAGLHLPGSGRLPLLRSGPRRRRLVLG